MCQLLIVLFYFHLFDFMFCGLVAAVCGCLIMVL